MSLYLGIDSSTQSITGLVIDTDGGDMELELSVQFDEAYAASYDVANGVLDLGDGQMHSPPLMWTEALEALFDRLRDSGSDLGGIAAVAGSGQQHGTV